MLPHHDVYITDWRDAAMVPITGGRFDLDTYIDYVIELFRHFGPDLHVLAVCQPGVPALAAASLMAADDDPDVPKSLTLMGSPIDTRANPTVPCMVAKQRPLSWFESHLIHRVPATYPGFLRRVYPGFLQLAGFMAMNLDRHVDAHVTHFQNLVKGDGDSAEKHRQFYDEYRAVMDLPADYYLQTVETVFQKHALATGEMRHRERAVEPAAISRTALMTVEGELDDISGLGQTVAAHALCTGLEDGRKAHYVQKGVGHYGVFNGSRWRNEIAPRIRKFIRRHD
jgi:poly(3-hydroxybutyrate) depolymerase